MEFGKNMRGNGDWMWGFFQNGFFYLNQNVSFYHGGQELTSVIPVSFLAL